MSGAEFKTAHAAAEVSLDTKGKRTYTAHYFARMDDAGDGPAAVLDYLETQNIYFGVPYNYNGDTDWTAFCKGIAPRRRQGSVEWWEITVTYGPADEEDKEQDPDGNPTDNPDDWRWQHTMGYSTWQEPCWSATNLDGFPHIEKGIRAESFIRNPGTAGPVVNSANVVLDPTLMRDMFDRVWQITTFSTTFDSATPDTYMGSLNDNGLQYHSLLTSKYGFVQKSFGIHEVKCTNATATYRILNRGTERIPYWEWAWEFRFRQSTWIEDVLDRGLSSLPEDGMATGTHGQSPSDDDTIPDGRSHVIPVVDSLGRRVPELVLFDGDGRPMLPSDPKFAEGYYFGWLKDTTADFTYPTLPFKFFS